mgnify:CR=1 FL=1
MQDISNEISVNEYFTSRNLAYLSMIDSLSKALYPNFYIISHQWKEDSFNPNPYIDLELRFHRSKASLRIKIVFNRTPTDLFIYDNCKNRLSLLDYVFNSIDISFLNKKHRELFSEYSSIIIEDMNKNFLQYPYRYNKSILAF